MRLPGEHEGHTTSDIIEERECVECSDVSTSWYIPERGVESGVMQQRISTDVETHKPQLMRGSLITPVDNLLDAQAVRNVR